MHRMIRRATIAGAAALAVGGVGAASASAYAISGGSFTAVSTGPHTFATGFGFVWTCQSVTATGNATGAATVSLTLTSFSSCDAAGIPGATVTASGPWSLGINAGPTSGVYSGPFALPSGSSASFVAPALGCIVVVNGAQSFSTAHTATNLGPGAVLNIAAMNVAFNQSGCPFASANDGVYRGSFYAPGITVS